MYWNTTVLFKQQMLTGLQLVMLNIFSIKYKMSFFWFPIGDQGQLFSAKNFFIHWNVNRNWFVRTEIEMNSSQLLCCVGCVSLSIYQWIGSLCSLCPVWMTQALPGHNPWKIENVNISPAHTHSCLPPPSLSETDIPDYYARFKVAGPSSTFNKVDEVIRSWPGPV